MKDNNKMWQALKEKIFKPSKYPINKNDELEIYSGTPVYSDVESIPFSKSNYLFEPLPYLPLDHPRNKNRHKWSLKDRAQLQIDLFGDLIVEPTGFFIALEEIKDIEVINNVIRNRTFDLSQEWAVGRIIGLGESCFEHHKFPFGARATFNDWVIFRKHDSNRISMRQGAILMVTDFSITTFVPDCNKLIEA